MNKHSKCITLYTMVNSLSNIIWILSYPAIQYTKPFPCKTKKKLEAQMSLYRSPDINKSS